MTLEDFIQKTIIKWKKILKISRPVFWTTDMKLWMQVTGLGEKLPTKKPFGAVVMPQNAIFLNVKRNTSLKIMRDTIVHELLHIKFPRKTNPQIEKLTKKLIKKH